MKKENLGLEKRFGGIKFLVFWMTTHIFLWGVTQGISSTVKLSLHLFIADIINPFICSLGISENNWGSTCTIIGLDFGLLAGQLISFLVAFLVGGVIAGIGEWHLINEPFNISVKKRKFVVGILIVVGLVTSFFVNFFAMFSGIINVIIGGVNLALAAFIAGFLFGGLFGVSYGIITFIIYHLTMSKNLANEL